MLGLHDSYICGDTKLDLVEFNLVSMVCTVQEAVYLDCMFTHVFC